MMKFGTKTTEQPVSTGTVSSGKYIQYFKKGEKRLRFLQEMDPGQDQFDGWTVFYDHFHPGKSRSFPCTGDRKTCPGCTSDNEKMAKASKRYLVNAVEPETGYVNLWKIPVSIIDDLIRYADKDGNSIIKRDYTVVQFKGDDDRVKYSVDREEKDEIDLSQWYGQMEDHQVALNNAYAEVWGTTPSEDGDAQARAGEENQVRDEPSAVGRPKPDPKATWASDEEKPPSEPAAVEPVSEQASDQGDDDVQEISEDQLRSMTASEIKALFRTCGLSTPDSDNVDELADQLIAAVGG